MHFHQKETAMANINRREWLQKSLLASSSLLIANHPMIASVFGQQSKFENTLLLAANENPYGPPKTATDAIIMSLSEANRYPFAIYGELEQAIAEKNNLSSEEVYLTAGSTEVLSLLGQHVGLKTGEILIPHPSFPTLIMFGERCGASIKKVPMSSDTIDLDQLSDSISDKTSLVYICNPNNPTSTEVAFNDLQTFCRKVPSTVLICIDEAYIEYSKDGTKSSLASLVQELPNLIICRTFSKVYGLAGLRIGYALSHKKNIHALRERHLGWGMATSMTSVIAAKAALSDSAFISKCVQKNEEGRQILYEAFDNWDVQYARSATNFVYTTSLNRFQKDFIQKLRAEKIQISQWGFMNYDYARISISTPEDMREFVGRLEKYLI